MIFENCVQVNSNFFYCKQFNIGTMPGKNILELNPKKLTQLQFNKLMEHVVFTKGYATKIKTNNGEFLFYSATNNFTPKVVQNFIINQSKFGPAYYFRNVDYFSYGEFGYAEDGKIVRYLKCNSEATDNENVVEWIGKPHTWEYETHTFYTKEKLENFEMSFDSESICDMVYFYLPFLKNDVKVENITIYSNQPNLKKLINGVLKDKPFENLLEFTSKHHAEIVKNLIHNNVETASTTILIYKDKLFFNNYVVNTDKYKKDDPIRTDILHDPSNLTIKTKDLNFNKFYNTLIKFIVNYKNAKQTNFKVVQKSLQTIKANDKYFQAHIITDFFEQDKKSIIAFAITKYFNNVLNCYTDQYNVTKIMGDCIDVKAVKKIYKEILKLQKAL